MHTENVWERDVVIYIIYLLNMFFWFHPSGRELFLSDASVFVDDAEAYEEYKREERSDAPEKKVMTSVILKQTSSNK